MIAASLRYFTIVFAVAFAIGAVRTLWLAPAIGATPAVLIELPVIFVVSWLAARAIVLRPVLMARRTAIGTGVLAFILLMAAEAALAVYAFGMTIDAWLAALARMPGPIGLAGQLIFALMPFLVREHWRLVRRPEG